jgi:hypothetical protein
MSTYAWQKSSYSGEAANCVNVAAAPDGSLRLRESDDPDVIVTVSRPAMRALLAAIKAGRSAVDPAG